MIVQCIFQCMSLLQKILFASKDIRYKTQHTMQVSCPSSSFPVKNIKMTKSGSSSHSKAKDLKITSVISRPPVLRVPMPGNSPLPPAKNLEMTDPRSRSVPPAKNLKTTKSDSRPPPPAKDLKMSKSVRSPISSPSNTLDINFVMVI